ncbi:MAG: pyrroline-5-carboxylate reductase family protein, partial [Thermoleophilia bacterium]
MIVGFVGSGNMAAAVARGLRGAVEGMLFTDSGSGRAGQLAAELAGEAVASNRELAERADVVVLAVKPAKLADAAAELGRPKVVVSLLGATSLETLRGAFPDADVVRVMPNVGVEVRKGVLCVTGDPDPRVRELLGKLG